MSSLRLCSVPRGYPSRSGCLLTPPTRLVPPSNPTSPPPAPPPAIAVPPTGDAPSSNSPTPSTNSTSPPLAPPPASAVPPAGDAPSSNSPTPSTNSTSPPPRPPPASPNGGLPPWKLVLIVGIGIGIVLVGVCIFVIFYRSKRRRLELGTNPLRGPRGMLLGFSQSTFTYEELKIATDGFSNLNLLGQGGFGYVHKGVLSSGKVVAIKQLKAGSKQGEREFQAEIEIISRIHHRHLVSLVGYCISGNQRILVYEFVPNSTLEFHLHGKDQPTMAWPVRMKIALGSARGLAYLHEECNPKIIHRDIKAANILLESNFEAKVADFGLAKFAFDTDTHVTTRVMGTFGYLAPEYASSGTLTKKSDVFSFGVVLLELITGRRPIDRTLLFEEDSMVDWARPLLTQALEYCKFDAIVDPKLHKDYDTKEMTRMIACAAACIRHSARHRPLMTQVVRAMEGNLSLTDLNEGIMPGHSIAYSRCESLDYDTSQDQEDSKNFRIIAHESQEQATSEFSVPNRQQLGWPSTMQPREWGSTSYPRDGLGQNGRRSSSR